MTFIYYTDMIVVFRRGLNPPHRVKSITMTSFSPDEMARLEGGGNEKVNHVWLAKWNERTDTEPDCADDQKMKYFMIEKYERKRWFDEGGRRVDASPAQGSSTPETRPLSSLLGSQAPKLVVTNKPVVRLCLFDFLIESEANVLRAASCQFISLTH